MKYVMTEAVAPEGMALLDQGEKVYVAHDANPANYTEEMKDADALIVRAAPAKIVNKAVMEALDGLPPVKVHCSLLAEEAIHAALWDYAQKHHIEIEGLKKPKSDIHEGEEAEEEEY